MTRIPRRKMHRPSVSTPPPPQVRPRPPQAPPIISSPMSMLRMCCHPIRCSSLPTGPPAHAAPACVHGAKILLPPRNHRPGEPSTDAFLLLLASTTSALLLSPSSPCSSAVVLPFVAVFQLQCAKSLSTGPDDRRLIDLGQDSESCKERGESWPFSHQGI